MLNQELNYENIEEAPLTNMKIKEISTKQQKQNKYVSKESKNQTCDSDFDVKCQQLRKFSNDLNIVMDKTLEKVKDIKKSERWFPASWHSESEYSFQGY